MRASYRNGLIAGGAILCIGGLLASPSLMSWRQFFEFKHNVQAHCDPVEIQRWAIRLQAEHGPDYKDETGTNLPPGFSQLSKHPPCVATFSDGCVAIGWGRYQTIYAGSSNYICLRPAEMWTPGVYFDKTAP